MITKVLLVILGLSLQSFTLSGDGKKQMQSQQSEPDYQIALQFINDYASFRSDLNSSISIVEWVARRQDVTDNFKSTLKKIIMEAEEEDPEMGLGFDPVFDAQDYPDRLEIEQKKSEYLIVKGTEWPAFRLLLKLKYERNKWLVDGCGIINIPEDMRIIH